MSDKFSYPEYIQGLMDKARDDLTQKLADAGRVIAPSAEIEYVHEPWSNSFTLSVDTIPDPRLSETWGAGEYRDKT